MEQNSTVTWGTRSTFEAKWARLWIGLTGPTRCAASGGFVVWPAAVTLIAGSRGVAQQSDMKEPDYQKLSLEPITAGKDFVGRPDPDPTRPKYSCRYTGTPGLTVGPGSNQTPIEISCSVPIQRYVGEVGADGFLTPASFATLLANGFIAEKAKVTLTARARGYPGETSPSYILEITDKAVVLVNGERAQFLGDNGRAVTVPFNDSQRWRRAEFEVDMKKIRFSPEKGAVSASSAELPPIAFNDIVVQFPVTTGYECYALAEARITIKVVSPVVLVHGINSNAESWNLIETRPALENAGLLLAVVDQPQAPADQLRFDSKRGVTVVYRRELGRPEDEEVSLSLQQTASHHSKSVGAAGVHFIGHSKGGLDSAHLVATQAFFQQRLEDAQPDEPTALSISTAGTPHLGSVFADLIDLHNRQAAVAASPRYRPYAINYFQVSPWYEFLVAEVIVNNFVTGRTGFSGEDSKRDIEIGAASYPEYFPQGWNSLTTEVRGDWWNITGSAFGRSKHLDLNSMGAHADRNLSKDIQLSEVDGLIGPQPWWVQFGATLGATPIFPITEAGLTQAFRYVGGYKAVKFTREVKDVDVGEVSQGTFQYTQIVVDATKLPITFENDIVVSQPSANPQSPLSVRFTTPKWYRLTEGRDHNQTPDASRVDQFKDWIRQADLSHGGLK